MRSQVSAIDQRDPVDATSSDDAWEQWGACDPYFSVLTDPKFRAESLTETAKEEFFALGRWHADHVLELCRRHLHAHFNPARVLDFGCGVGRVLIPFAANADEVVGMDISASMLAEARRNCEQRGLRNVVLLPSDDRLSAAGTDFDLVHCAIVLQHIPLERGRAIFAELVRRVRPGGGCGALHVTFAWDIYGPTFGQIPPPVPEPVPPRKVLVKAWLRRMLESAGLLRPRPPAVPVAAPPGADPEMQMNYYNLSELSFILQQAGVTHHVTELTNHGGALGAFIFFRR